MVQVKRFFWLGLFASILFLAGCGQQTAQPTMPFANAGTDQVIFVNLQCQLDGSLSSGNLAAYSWKALSYPSAAAPQIIAAAASKAYFIPTALGTYEFELDLSNALGFSSAEVKFTAVSFEAPSIEAGFYGMCCHLSSHDDPDLCIAKMAEIGVQFVRFDFDWKAIEPADDSFNYLKYDQIIAKIKANSIKALGILDYGNSWSDPTTGDTGEIDRFADFAYNTVKHFKNDVKFWQIWNEPNNELFWTAPSAANYTKLLKSAYSAVKQADPDAVVILGGLVGNGKDDLFLFNTHFAVGNFLSDIYNSGGGRYFDVAAIHPYSFSTDISSTVSLEAAIADARQIMADNADGAKELWITEMGPLFFPPILIPQLSSRAYGEDEIAGWLTLIYTGLRTKCDKLFWYELRDYPGITSQKDPNWEGLVSLNYINKAAFAAYKNLSK